MCAPSGKLATTAFNFLKLGKRSFTWEYQTRPRDMAGMPLFRWRIIWFLPTPLAFE
jgi:hypothetical protein